MAVPELRSHCRDRGGMIYLPPLPPRPNGGPIEELLRRMRSRGFGPGIVCLGLGHFDD
jgi:hypothetical protein